VVRILWPFYRILWSLPRYSSKPGSSEFTTQKFRIQVGKNIHLKNSEKISMSIKFQNYYGCSRSWNLLLSPANTLKIKSSQRDFAKPGSSGFQQLYHYLARDLPFHPSFILSHTARHFYCSGEAILWRFKDLTKDFKGQRWDLGDFNPEVPDPPSGIDFKPFSP